MLFSSPGIPPLLPYHVKKSQNQKGQNVIPDHYLLSYLEQVNFSKPHFFMCKMSSQISINKYMYQNSALL